VRSSIGVVAGMGGNRRASTHTLACGRVNAHAHAPHLKGGGGGATAAASPPPAAACVATAATCSSSCRVGAAALLGARCS